ncbi:MAG: hypothetical protein WD314_05420 [Trueperaceae bacterium]
MARSRSRALPSELSRGAYGAWAWLLQRLSALLLLVLLPIKIWSGYVFTGKASGPAGLASLHVDPVIDGLLLFALAFHVLFGLRVVLIDLGMARHSATLFKLSLLLAVGLSVAAIAAVR